MMLAKILASFQQAFTLRKAENSHAVSHLPTFIFIWAELQFWSMRIGQPRPILHESYNYSWYRKGVNMYMKDIALSFSKGWWRRRRSARRSKRHCQYHFILWEAKQQCRSEASSVLPGAMPRTCCFLLKYYSRGLSLNYAKKKRFNV
jgi:hypothetical protein